MAEMLLLTAKFETDFQRFILVICLWEMNPNNDAH